MVSKISGMDDKTWALQQALLELEAIERGDLDLAFVRHRIREIRKALAVTS